MLLLTSTSDLIQLITASALAMDVHVSYMDYNGTTVTPGRQNTAISTATTTTIVSSPGASTQRNVKTITIRNTDTATAQIVTVQHTDGTTVATQCKVTLLAKETLQYVDKFGFVILDNAGEIKIGPSASKFLGLTVLTSASGTFTTQAATNIIKIRGVGGGGQGGGATGGSSLASAGTGGGAGGYVEKLFGVAGSTGYSYTCGAGGSTSSGNNAGQNGGNSTFVVGSVTVTAFGGGGGPAGGSAGSTVIIIIGGSAPSVSTNGDVNGGGQAGDPSYRLSGTIAVSGGGGSGIFGGGGNALTTDAVGIVGTGQGAGGGGACSLTTTVRNGGAGTGGCWVVEEYT